VFSIECVGVGVQKAMLMTHGSHELNYTAQWVTKLYCPKLMTHGSHEPCCLPPVEEGSMVCKWGGWPSPPPPPPADVRRLPPQLHHAATVNAQQAPMCQCRSNDIVEEFGKHLLCYFEGSS
jgi:hypothetical protein